MKELSIEEKAKHYDEAIERAKSLIDFCSDSELKTLEYVFHELKESKDEKIRKELIQYLKDYPNLPNGQYSRNDFFTWLEKQGNQKSTDKIKPKFKCDDIIVDEEGEIYRVINAYDVVKDTYGLKNLIDGVFSEVNIDTVDSKFHLWTIADSKKDKMIIYPSNLNNGECIFVLKETDENGVIRFNVQKRS
jgi:hypothetical protein